MPKFVPYDFRPGMRIKINGDWQDWPAPEAALVEVLAQLGLNPDTGGVAVAVNLAVVPRSRWAEHRLADGDEIEVVTARQGG